MATAPSIRYGSEDRCPQLSGNSNTAVGAAALLLNSSGTRTQPLEQMPWCLTATATSTVRSVASRCLTTLTDSRTTPLAIQRCFNNINGANNTAVGDLALENNDVSGSGMANNNTGVGGGALTSNEDGSENTAVGAGAGPNLIDGFNNTYVGNFVGSDPSTTDESSTIRIGDISNGNGAGSLACYIGGIWNNLQPVGGNVVQVTLNLDTDELGYDFGPNQGIRAPVHRNAPTRRGAPLLRAPAQRQAKLNDKVDNLQATVAQQQKQIETQHQQINTLTAQLQEQAAQIQKVSAQLEIIRPTPRVVNNR